MLIDLPYELDWGIDQGKILDGAGVGTGFTWIDDPSKGTGYIPGNLDVDLAAGTLDVTTTKGIAYQAVDTQDNALGVGIDVVDVARVTRLLERKGQRALNRLLTEAERDYCLTQPEPARHVAVRLAAKEAAFKAFHSGGARRMISWREIEVQRQPHGEPTLRLLGRARQSAADLELARAVVSLSHSHTQAVAIVLLLA